MSVIIKTIQCGANGKPISIGEFIMLKKECNILSLSTQEEYRNKGHADNILKEIISYCKNHNISSIYVDDMSERFNKSNNIYIKNGFKYVVKGFPQMQIIL